MEINSICGFKIQAAEVKLLTHADDIAIFAQYRESVIEAVNFVREFNQVTDSGVSWPRCLGPWNGAWSSRFEDYIANVLLAATTSKAVGVPLDGYRDIEGYWTAQAKDIRETADK